jgi:hypothetical protein
MVLGLGSRQHAVVYQNYTFWFLNASNAATFVANPTRYLPAWGGFCAWGVSREGTNGNPSPAAEANWPWSTRHMGPPCNPHTGWVVRNDRLFCAINRDYINRFLNLGNQGVQDGDQRWINWYGTLSAGPFNTGCWPGIELQTCMSPGKPFANRTVGAGAGPPTSSGTGTGPPTSSDTGPPTSSGSPKNGSTVSSDDTSATSNHGVLIAAIAIGVLVVSTLVFVGHRKFGQTTATFTKITSDNAVFGLDDGGGGPDDESDGQDSSL